MIEYIVSCIIKSLLLEVNTEPKAGLVCPNSDGSHKDMNYTTFINSIYAISPYFMEAAQLASKWSFLPNNAFDLLREIGLRCDEAMLKVTNGANTHKGAVFSFLILSASSVFSFNKSGCFNIEKICEVSSVIASKSLDDFNRTSSKGINVCKENNVLGVRGEAASGFKTALNIGVPSLKESMCINANYSYVYTLTQLMANTDDTNVLSRSGVEGLNYLKSEAIKLLNLSGEKLIDEHKKLDKKLIEKNISPGGCADLLAISIFLYELENYNG